MSMYVCVHFNVCIFVYARVFPHFFKTTSTKFVLKKQEIQNVGRKFEKLCANMLTCGGNMLSKHVHFIALVHCFWSC